MCRSNVLRGAAALLGALIAARSLAAPPEEQTVCRYESRPGSRILLHSCMTAAQWLAADKDKREAATRLGGAAAAGNATSIVGSSIVPATPAQTWGGFQRY
jgi:hypothetical protein